jgi:hypothetical protein
VISCRGDAWERDKYDNYGNCKERHIPIEASSFFRVTRK